MKKKPSKRDLRQAQIDADLPSSAVQDRQNSKMKIHSISATNFKGKDIAAIFTAPITMIVGRNFVGKTAILQAIKLALLGFVPGMSKRPRDIFDAFCSGTAMNVALNMGGTHLIERAWVMERHAVKAAHQYAAGLPEMPLVALDAKTYFEMPAQDRIGLIFQTMQLDSSNIQMRIAELVRDFERQGMEGPARTLREITTTVGDRFQDWIERAHVRLKELHREHDASASRMNQTVQGLAHLENQGGIQPVAELQDSLATARTDLEGLVAAEAKARAPFEEANANAQQRARHNELIKRYEPVAGTLAVAQETAEIDPDGAPPLKPAHNKFLAARDANHDAQLAARNANEALEAFDTQQKELAGKPACPTCKRPFTGKKAGEVQASIGAERERLDNALKETTETADKAAAALTEAEKEYRELEAKAEAYGEKRQRLEEARQALERAQNAVAQVEESRQMLAAIGTVETSEAGAEEAQRLAEEIEAKREEISGLEKQIKGADMAAGGLKRLSEARQESERFKTLAITYKNGVKALEAKREEFIGEAFKPLLKVCNLFGEGIMVSPLEYHEGALGRRRDDGGWISMVSFSGAEEAITYAAINAALGATSPARIVLMDEMGRIDVTNKVALIKNVVAAIEGRVIEQFIGIDVEATAYNQINTEAKESDPEAKDVVMIAALQ